MVQHVFAQVPTQPGTPTGDTLICQNDSNRTYVTSGSANATSYHWVISPVSAGTISGTGTAGTVDWSVFFSGTAQISVTAINASGQTSSQILNVVLKPLPGKPGTPVGVTPICVGTLSSDFTTTGGTNATSYLWKDLTDTLNTFSGTGATGTLIWNPTFSGVARVVVYGVNSCGVGPNSDSIMISVVPSLTLPTTPAGPSPLCQGTDTSVYTTTGPNFATNYQWHILPPAAGTIGGTGLTATVHWLSNYIGTVKIFVADSNSCASSALSSDTLFVVLNPTPLTPIITDNGNVLHSDYATGNQWYDQNGIIVGAIYQNYTPSTNGDYYVMVTLNGCSTLASNTIQVLGMNIQFVENYNAIQIYPNPASEELTIEAKSNNDKIEFEILNPQGQLIYKESFIEKATVQTRNFAKGVYIIKLDDGRGFEFRKMVKE